MLRWSYNSLRDQISNIWLSDMTQHMLSPSSAIWYVPISLTMHSISDLDIRSPMPMFSLTCFQYLLRRPLPGHWYWRVDHKLLYYGEDKWKEKVSHCISIRGQYWVTGILQHVVFSYNKAIMIDMEGPLTRCRYERRCPPIAAYPRTSTWSGATLGSVQL